jgi:hypothetical protein
VPRDAAPLSASPPARRAPAAGEVTPHEPMKATIREPACASVRVGSEAVGMPEREQVLLLAHLSDYGVD